ncbi:MULTISPECIES: cysteine hydrolase family protein [unclassified Rhizobium]|uniref:cysteine hydrolase family protein n=1 Tax=unclassified Rhizobium TaxID=2613769 RepID=UPI00178573A3|nr:MULTISPECIES: cysteine hydrolase family protein [unclassified Rhizobium]MBD8689279.1 cysteine hydrolase family protein [Rhizobium sp. CFBP 13644]MBD8693175.1 cysteine hydrolase family protein [Rhizobium sp. CFBP 13717]
MKQVLYIVDIQPSFNPPVELVDKIKKLVKLMPSVASVERHDESITPFESQLGWKPAPSDESLIAADRVFIKYGYAPPKEAVDYLLSLEVDRVLVCGIQADTCVLAAGFSFFDAGLRPTLLPWLTVGSSLDRSGALGARLWKHHFREALSGPEDLGL